MGLARVPVAMAGAQDPSRGDLARAANWGDFRGWIN